MDCLRLVFFTLCTVVFLNHGNCLEDSSNLAGTCPRIMRHIFEQAAPAGGEEAGKFTEHKNKSMNECVEECCQAKNNCNVAFVFNHVCYHVQCISNELCLPKQRPQLSGKLQMVLVNPVSDEAIGEVISWIDLLKTANINDFLPATGPEKSPNFGWKIPQTFRVPNNPYISDDEQVRENVAAMSVGEKRLDDFLLNRNFDLDRYGTEQQYPPAEESDLSIDDRPAFMTSASLFCKIDTKINCRLNEECKPLTENTRRGVCQCIEGYALNKAGVCVRVEMEYSSESLVGKILNTAMGDEMGNMNSDEGSPRNDNLSSMEKLEATKPPLQKLAVSVASKKVRLPEKEVSLAAFTVPDEASSRSTYKYLWTLIQQPSGAVNGTISDQTKDEIKLSNLSEGLYTFKVTVTSNSSYGEALANITVLPEKRINKVPQAIITPKELTIKYPNSQAILDGSTSIDDDRIDGWHWELIQGPIGYQPKLPETATLQLTDLCLPGNYTFKLTVTDSDKAQNSTTANITVLKRNDYPPEANAGTDVIVYLPKNNVTLNGSLSADDREIVAWEWTKDVGKAVDMQNTRTPYLDLSNLEEGMYTFVLKVTDGSNQSNTAKVHVFVKTPINLPPVSNAGRNKTINLPQTWVILNGNGSESKDNNHLTEYYWHQIAGPNIAVIANMNSSMANATSLTVGNYVFELVVVENNISASDIVWVKVIQEKNSPPVANAGGDLSVTLPVSAIYLNGSKSSDDLGIVNFSWTRDSTSLAVGSIVGSSDHEPVLILTNVVPGRFVFRLTVADEQGLTSSDTVSIIVHADPIVLNLVELTLSMGISILSQSELESLEQKIILLIGGDVKLRIREVKVEPKSDDAIVVFYIEKLLPDGKTQIMPGLEVEKILKNKFWKDASILGTTFTDVRTSICQNKCSDHGLCNTVTRSCMCETFWMPSIFYFWGLEEANCEWSILYVIVGIFVGFIVLSGMCWGITCLCRKTHKPRPSRSKIQKYALLGTHDDEMPPFVRGTSLSDSETDSDVLYESRSKQNGILRANGISKNGSKYSTTRLSNRIKT